MRGPAFMRDCFPSGHTATTLLVLTFAYRHARRFFWAILPVGVLLIAATVICRFHYGIDLLAAVPLCVFAVAVAHALGYRRAPYDDRDRAGAGALDQRGRSTRGGG